MWIVDDPAAAALPLPHAYGIDDIPLILQDKRLDDDGRLEFSQGMISPIGRLGGQVLVNGTYDPHLAVRDSLVRFRLRNASTARVYAVGFADERRFDLIATDGGLLEQPAAMSRVQLSPGERAEIVARFQPRERVVLQSFPPNLNTDFFTERFAGGDDTLDLLQLRAAANLRPSPELPGRLAAARPGDAGQTTTTRRFELSGSRRINDRTMEMARIDAVVQRDTTEIWEVGNPYMFHRHLLEHEDRGMMGQFVVVPPGERPGHPPAHHHDPERNTP
jgi:blue copper oxidase